MVRVCLCSLVSMALAFWLAGCGGGGAEGGDVKLANAGGTVTYKSSPLAGAQVTFIPEKGPIASGTTDLQGKFKLFSGALQGVAVGNCKVTVVAIEGGGKAADAPATASSALPKTPEEGKKRMEDQKKAMASGVSEGAPAAKTITPAKYANPETSGLSFTVKADGANDFPITLTD